MSRCRQPIATDGPHKVDMQIDGGEILPRVQRSPKRNPHRRVCKSRENPSVHSPHRVVQTLIDVEQYRRLAVGAIRLARGEYAKADQSRNRCIGKRVMHVVVGFHSMDSPHRFDRSPQGSKFGRQRSSSETIAESNVLPDASSAILRRWASPSFPSFFPPDTADAMTSASWLIFQRCRFGLQTCLGLVALSVGYATSVAGDLQSQTDRSLQVIPAKILATPRYPARIAITATNDRGEASDISQQPDVAVRVLDESIAQFDKGVVRFHALGSTELEIQWRGATARVPLETSEDAPLAFDREITSLLTRSGCNLGTCHGNLHGKGGMRLSLRGDDPAFDYYRLARECAQRRIDLWEPKQSLIVRKATGQVAHQGGARFDLESIETQWLCQWLESGALSSSSSPLVSLEVMPRLQRMRPGEHSARWVVHARFADGSIRDVTRWSRIEPSVASGVEVSTDGRVHVDKPTDVSFSATYLSGRASARVIFLGESPDRSGSTQPDANPIDLLVEAQCRELNVPTAPRADDWTLARRLYLVTLGRLPTPDETLAFVDNSEPDKVDRTVDRLLADPAFDYAWAMRWSDLIRNEDKVMSSKGAALLHHWLRQQIASDRSMQAWIDELVSSVGSTYENPPASYHRTHRDPFTTAESSAQVFLGVRVQCAKCHNHPFDVWKQDDYYGLAAYFTTIERKQIDNKPKDELDKHIITGDEIISLAERAAEMMHPGRSLKVPPRPLAFRDSMAPVPAQEQGTVLAQFGRWLTTDNAQFDANLANRIWYQYFGRGIVDPPDDFRDSNPPTNPELLRWLASELRRGDYSLKQLSRTLLCSQTFARQSGADASESSELNGVPYFASFPTRRIAAEILLDAVSDACDAYPQVHPGNEEGASPIRRAMEMPGVPVKKGFLRTFGKPDRLLVCECERTNQVSLGQSLSLLNGREVRDRLTQVDNRIGQLVQAEVPFSAKVQELFLATLSRRPSQRELDSAAAMLQANSDRPASIDEIAIAIQQSATASRYKERRVLEDILWALINSKEFSILR